MFFTGPKRNIFHTLWIISHKKFSVGVNVKHFAQFILILLYLYSWSFCREFLGNLEFFFFFTNFLKTTEQSRAFLQDGLMSDMSRLFFSNSGGSSVPRVRGSDLLRRVRRDWHRHVGPRDHHGGGWELGVPGLLEQPFQLLHKEY